MRRWRLGLAALFSFVWVTQAARAAGPLGPNGAPLTTSEYALDLFQGPVFAGSRVTGLAGAYVAISEDVDGDLQNPAAPAVRPFFSYSHFDYWLGFGLTFPATLENTDFFNSGSKTQIINAPDAFVFFTPAANLQWGEFAVGVTLEVQNYALSKPAEPGSSTHGVSVFIPTAHVQFAHGFANNQLVLGLGTRFVSMQLSGPERTRSSFDSSGSGLEFGAVWKPTGMPLRLGAAFRTGIRTNASYSQGFFPNENGDLIATNGVDQVYMPKAVVFPWDLNFGFAVQLGARPFNPPWVTSADLIERQALQHRLRELDREDERNEAMASATTSSERAEISKRFNAEQKADDRRLANDLFAARQRIERNLLAMNRFYVQVAGSALVSGAVDGAVGVESLVSQVVNRSGERAVISLHLGAEAGVVPTLLKLRAGTYLEPTRFETSEPRLHATAGLDIKLAVWNVFGLWPDDYMWRLGLGGDLARQYYMWGLTIGGWYPRHKSESELAEPSRGQLGAMVP
jgi:hypothetical protein